MNKQYNFLIGDHEIHADVNICEMKTYVACVEACNICIEVFSKLGYETEALLCLECAEIGEILIKFKCCNARFTSAIAQLFAEICNQCMTECAKLDIGEAKKLALLCTECIKNIRHAV